MTDQPANLVLTMLREMRADQIDMKQDIRALRETQSMHGMMLGELVKSAARTEGETISLRTRVERLEQAIGIMHAPLPTDH